jgi:hypothetical protein
VKTTSEKENSLTFFPHSVGIYPCIGAIRFESVKSSFFSLIPNSLVASSALPDVSIPDPSKGVFPTQGCMNRFRHSYITPILYYMKRVREYQVGRARCEVHSWSIIRYHTNQLSSLAAHASLPNGIASISGFQTS